MRVHTLRLRPLRKIHASNTSTDLHTLMVTRVHLSSELFPPRAGERHATLATTIEWSYHLLSDASRDLFERLGVFPASFDLAAVRAVSAGLDVVAATNTIGDLVAKSLVVHDDRSGRYRLLESIRL